MKNFVGIFIFLISIFFVCEAFSQIDTKDTRMMTQPAISKDHIAFIYANDLWLAGRDGQNPHRLTIDEGIESNPFFSPDGKWIAFSAQYDGNTDVFIIPCEGGVPKRLTFHPSPDIVCGFTPDGKNILFTSPMNSFTGRYSQFYTIPITGGFPEKLKIPTGFKASYSPDGTKLAYIPYREVFRQWKHYRGGTACNIWIYNMKDLSIVKIPQPEGRCNDTDPMWYGDFIYFNSDRNGEFNLFSYNTITKEIKQITNHTDFPVLSCSKGNGNIIYEQGGYLHILDLSTNQTTKLTIGISADLLTIRPRYLKGNDYIRNYNLSPTGIRAVFESRGEILTVPAEKGDIRNLTNTTGANERSPVWSPDGKFIAYFSDETGEYQINIAPQDGKGETKKFKLNGSGFYSNPLWSPDSKKIVYRDNGNNLAYIEIASGNIIKIATEPIDDQFSSLHGDWSPDSKWITYTLLNTNWFQIVYLYSLETGQSYMVTDGMSDATEPIFDKSGKYLYFLGSTNSGPVKQWFDQSNADMKMTSNIYLAVLSKDTLSPLAKESDEEKPKASESVDTQKDKKKKDKKDDKKEDEKSKEPLTVIDIDGIGNRIISLPVPAGDYSGLQAGKEGEIYFIEAGDDAGTPGGAKPTLHKFDLKKKKDEEILQNCSNYTISSDNNKILYESNKSYSIGTLGDKIDLSQGHLNLSQLDLYIDPITEWKQIFEEVWRINRDYFYDPNYHGADWNALKTKYEAFLPHLSCRSDLNRLIQWLCSELAVGHSYSGGGDYFINKKNVSVGLLGADYELVNNRYQFKKIFGGMNWTPELRSPLTEPGINVKEGDYLISVNGKNLTTIENIYAMFENTAGKIVEISVSKSPDGKDAKSYQVVPISSEYGLRNMDWVEGNIKKVHQATNGRVAYVWVPDTHIGGHNYFKRYFFPQADKDAIIIDERFNGGGLVADYYIDILKRPYICSNTTRYGEDEKVPGASIQGPKVMLIDEEAGSGGDLLPWMFRKFKMGTLIGKRTWGGLVGISGYPVLMDGGFVTSPNLGIWAESGWICENEGVPPDIDIDQLPVETSMGNDPQLDKAIEVIMQQLKDNPPVKHIRPAFPVKVKK